MIEHCASVHRKAEATVGVRSVRPELPSEEAKIWAALGFGQADRCAENLSSK